MQIMKSEQGRRAPILIVGLPTGVYAAVHAIAKLQGKAVTALAREAICACFAGLLDEVELAQKLQRCQAPLRRWEEVKP